MPFLTILALIRARLHTKLLFGIRGMRAGFILNTLITRPEIIFTRPIIVDIYKFDNF